MKTVAIDMKPVKIFALEATAERRIVTKPIMLKVIASGRITLYSTTDENNKNHLFVQKDTTTQELDLVRYLIQNKIIELKMYLGLLKNLTADCNKIHVSDRIFSEASIKSFVTKYNECVGERSYVKKSEKLQFHGGLKAGVSYTTLRYVGFDQTANGNYPYPVASDVKFSFAPAFEGGVWLDVGSKKISNPFYLTLGANYKTSGTMSGDLSGTGYVRKYTAKYGFTTLNLGVKYFFHNRSPKLYLIVAANFSHLNSYSNEAIINDGTTGYSAHKQTFAEYKVNGLGYRVGLGWSYNRLYSELSFQDDIFSALLPSKSHLAALGVNVGLKLF